MMSSAPFLYTTELESLTSLCFRGLDGVDYDGTYFVEVIKLKSNSLTLI